MNRAVQIVLVCSWIVFFGTSTTRASTLIFTNSPCVYLLVSNSLSQSAMLLGSTGSISGALTVPVSVKSSLFGVTAIAPGAFKNCGNLTGVALDTPSKVAAIGAGAFWGCTNLVSVTYDPSTLAELNGAAFRGCSSLTNLPLSAALTNVASRFLPDVRKSGRSHCRRASRPFPTISSRVAPRSPRFLRRFQSAVSEAVRSPHAPR